MSFSSKLQPHSIHVDQRVLNILYTPIKINTFSLLLITLVILLSLFSLKTDDRSAVYSGLKFAYSNYGPPRSFFLTEEPKICIVRF